MQAGARRDAVARAFTGEGARVFLADHARAPLEEVALIDQPEVTGPLGWWA
jgi:hypothetical protein